jgi:hypothetical protein
MRTLLRFYVPLLIWVALIFGSSLVLPSWKFSLDRFNLDTIFHFFEYGILCGLLSRAIYHSIENRHLKRTLLLALGISFLIAGIDEMHQLYLPGRTSSFYDFIADIIGIVCALAAFWYFENNSAAPHEMD